ncbi:MAG TPA: copper resistance protein CopC [Candidatus Brachybacterium intestinipullorum]|uniref:Copper resistance protein CopC n=1 Tax=Candidatus Brachybacterium intestinipullorum TaxID=2838512 RepID=A0A9D2TIG9_9MICO|nr:copper resistance protein CopC [Candidatus Brachybacterium intestinipullorum]
MNTVLSRRTTARPAALAAVFAALLAALLLLGAPAQAHDTLLESDPADGATLETSPEAITLTYSADILDVSPLVRITDEDGEQLAEITPSIDGPVATAALEEPLPAGESTIQWRVVSSDGHPIEGTFTVTVEQDAAEEPADEEAPAASDGGEDSAAQDTASDDAASDAADDSAAEDSAAEEDSGSSLTPILVVLGVVVVGAVVAVVVIVRRRD